MDIPDELINLERIAEQERARVAGLAGEEYDAQWKACREASAAVQAAITAHAAESGASRYDVEQAVKRAARRIEQDPAE
ncbi:hypothetical protein ABZZ47_39365 [Streptomyces sp. NPDC006465]|uniref:hypothetical protein n=1 Tax=Streptomyces sp. NPDC006465 TaxID=3157174 RepID=UPI0033B1403A